MDYTLGILIILNDIVLALLLLVIFLKFLNKSTDIFFDHGMNSGVVMLYDILKKHDCIIERREIKGLAATIEELRAKTLEEKYKNGMRKVK